MPPDNVVRQGGRQRHHRLHEIWPDAELAGLRHFFVEQGGNFTRGPIRSITDSAEYVTRVLIREDG